MKTINYHLFFTLVREKLFLLLLLIINFLPLAAIVFVVANPSVIPSSASVLTKDCVLFFHLPSQVEALANISDCANAYPEDKRLDSSSFQEIYNDSVAILSQYEANDKIILRDALRINSNLNEMSFKSRIARISSPYGQK